MVTRPPSPHLFQKLHNGPTLQTVDNHTVQTTYHHGPLNNATINQNIINLMKTFLSHLNILDNPQYSLISMTI